MGVVMRSHWVEVEVVVMVAEEGEGGVQGMPDGAELALSVCVEVEVVVATVVDVEEVLVRAGVGVASAFDACVLRGGKVACQARGEVMGSLGMRR